MYLENSKAYFKEKTSKMSEYFVKIEVHASFATNIAICAIYKWYTLSVRSLLELSKEVIYIIKVLYFKLNAIATNSFFLIILTYLVIEKTFLRV